MIPRILVLANQKSENYIHAIEKCDGVASIDYNEPLDSFDGLLLCGGNDIHPSYYGQEIDGACDFDQARDAREFKILKAFLDTGKPILGICRGMQLLNVVLGGTLIQDILEKEAHTPTNGVDLVHSACAKGILEEIYGNELLVNSSHHQAVDRLGSGLFVNALCGGIIEGFEHESLPYLGVQFHPERMYENGGTSDGMKIFEHFIKLCK
jgi:putative glutamine amidotransferase